MPIYDYECLDCKLQFEVEAKMSDSPPTGCPTCSKANLRKMISRTSFVLKGGGWYVTDYKSTKKSAGSEQIGTGESSTTSTKSAETKDATGSPSSDIKVKEADGAKPAADKTPAAKESPINPKI